MHGTSLVEIRTAWLVEMRRGLESKAGRRILSNVAALSIAQAASYLLPLVVIPYTAAVLGPRTFGMVALIQAMVQYSTLITNYGFSFSATRLAAVSQGDPSKLAHIVVHVWTAKLLLMLGCLTVSLAVFAVLPSLRQIIVPYLCGFVMVLGNVLYLDWFFQAIEEMKWITAINVIPKVLLTPLVFVLVKAPGDYVRLLGIQSATFLVSGVAGAWLVRGRLRAPLRLPTVRDTVRQFRDGWHAFLASLTINLYTSTNIVILSLMTNATVVGYYSAAHKIVLAAQSLWMPVSQALYPHFCKSFSGETRRTGKSLLRLAGVVSIVTLTGAILCSVLAPRLVPLYLGVRFAQSVPVMRILIFTVCAVTANNIFGLQGLLAAGLQKPLLQAVALAALLNLLLAPTAIALYGATGLAAAVVSVETLLALFELRLLRQESLI